MIRLICDYLRLIIIIISANYSIIILIWFNLKIIKLSLFDQKKSIAKE